MLNRIKIIVSRSPSTLIEDASGAALKAIQCLESVNRGVSVHPRSGDVSVPEFALQRCTQCKRCTEECPFGTLNEDVKGTPQFNALRCEQQKYLVRIMNAAKAGTANTLRQLLGLGGQAAPAEDQLIIQRVDICTAELILAADINQLDDSTHLLESFSNV